MEVCADQATTLEATAARSRNEGISTTISSWIRSSVTLS